MPITKELKRLLDRANTKAFNEGYQLLVILCNTENHEVEVSSNVSDDKLVVAAMARNVLEEIAAPNPESDEDYLFEDRKGKAVKVYKA